MARSLNVRLDRLARKFEIPQRTAQNWFNAGLIRGENFGPGGGRGVLLKRAEAIDAVALFILRSAGLPLQRIKTALRSMTEANDGASWWTCGTDGAQVLRDGRGADVPLRDVFGQGYLGFVLDLRRLRAEAERIVAEVEAEAMA